MIIEVKLIFEIDGEINIEDLETYLIESFDNSIIENSKEGEEEEEAFVESIIIENINIL